MTNGEGGRALAELVGDLELALLPYDEAAARVDELVTFFEAHPDATVRERMAELLQLIDALHRTPLQRLVALLETYGWDGGGSSVPPLERASADAVIRRLLQLYDLAPLPPVAPAAPVSPVVTADQLRATLHARGGRRQGV
jgi:hypothetical protein